ncbi:MAG: hypothetical protein JWO36_7535 [Myxococcales bacterium]|nr:hypothetical protein [Myxococcales bacterium]
MRILSLMVALGFVACSGSSPAEVDADPRGPTCTKALYDLCSTEHDCTSAMCHPFMAFQVCTQACDASTPCPAPTGGGAATCDATGICKPDAPNHCHL